MSEKLIATQFIRAINGWVLLNSIVGSDRSITKHIDVRKGQLMSI